MRIFDAPIVIDNVRKENQDMKTMELQKSLLNEVAAILDNEEMTEKAIRSIRRIRSKAGREEKKEEEAENLEPYTMEEINAMIDESEADIRAGRVIPSEQVFREIREELRTPFG